MSCCANCSRAIVFLGKRTIQWRAGMSMEEKMALRERRDKLKHYVRCVKGHFLRRIPVYSEDLRELRGCPDYDSMGDDIDEFLKNLPKTNEEYEEWW